MIKARHRKNLETLKRYLANYDAKSAPAEFTMSVFASFPNTSVYTVAELIDAATDCGTAGCALGHGPHAGIKKSAKEDWWKYSKRAYGIGSESIEWAWLFSDEWAEHDRNTAYEAAQRIQYYLDNDGHIGKYEIHTADNVEVNL